MNHAYVKIFKKYIPKLLVKISMYRVSQKKTRNARVKFYVFIVHIFMNFYLFLDTLLIKINTNQLKINNFQPLYFSICTAPFNDHYIYGIDSLKSGW